jgi:hypothetical protein
VPVAVVREFVRNLPFHQFHFQVFIGNKACYSAEEAPYS